MGATHIPQRIDEQGNAYKCTADDAAYATFELEGGIIAHFNSSWTVRVRRDDLLTLQVDGTKGSAVAGLRECYIQHYGNTPNLFGILILHNLLISLKDGQKCRNRKFMIMPLKYSGNCF